MLPTKQMFVGEYLIRKISKKALILIFMHLFHAVIYKNLNYKNKNMY